MNKLNSIRISGWKSIKDSDDIELRQLNVFIGANGWIHVDRTTLDASSPDILKIKLNASDTHLYESNNHRQEKTQRSIAVHLISPSDE